MTDYRPIACAQYEFFELAIMRHTPLKLAWSEAGQSRLETITPEDLETANHEEFLLARGGDGHTYRIRLDRIIRAEQA